MRLRRAVWAALAVAASGFAIASVFSWYPARRAIGGYSPDWTRAIAWELLRWNLWLPISAWMIRWDHRFRTRRWAATGAALILFAALHTVLLLTIYFPMISPRAVAVVTTTFFRYRFFVVISDYLTGLIVCGLVLGLAHARRASQLETQLAGAQLDALRMQIHPHFLFNTLNAIAALQRQDSEAAQRMMVRLADFLRLTLESSGDQEVSLRREVDFLSRYLEIERIRFAERLAVDMAIDPDALDARVPNLILQPIVENAIRHGVAARSAPGRLEIGASRRNGCLFLRVKDSGPGMKPSPSEGIGLINTRARLDKLYGRASRLSLENAQDGGLEVTIQIPLVMGPAL